MPLSLISLLVFDAIPNAPLYNALAADELGNAVCGEEKNYAYNRLDHTYNGRHRDKSASDTEVIYIKVEDLDAVLVYCIGEYKVLVHTV